MIRLFGVTREVVTGHFMIVAQTVEWDLRHYVLHHFARLIWEHKLSILHSIASNKSFYNILLLELDLYYFRVPIRLREFLNDF